MYMSKEKAESYVGQHVQTKDTGFISRIQSYEGKYAAWGNVWYVYSDEYHRGTFLTENEIIGHEHIIGDMAIAIYGVIHE